MDIQIENYSPFYRLFHQMVEKEKVSGLTRVIAFCRLHSQQTILFSFLALQTGHHSQASGLIKLSFQSSGSWLRILYYWYRALNNKLFRVYLLLFQLLLNSFLIVVCLWSTSTHSPFFKNVVFHSIAFSLATIYLPAQSRMVRHLWLKVISVSF